MKSSRKMSSRRSRNDDYKNFEILLMALVGTNFHVICVGGEIWSQLEKDFLVKNGLTNQVNRINIDDDDDLWFLLGKSAGLICTSKYEGFSLPVLEALTIGTPAICSDIRVHREIYGQAPLYFPFDNAIHLRDQLETVFEKDIHQNSKTWVENHNFKNCTWLSCEKKHVEYYSSLCKNTN